MGEESAVRRTDKIALCADKPQTLLQFGHLPRRGIGYEREQHQSKDLQQIKRDEVLGERCLLRKYVYWKGQY